LIVLRVPAGPEPKPVDARLRTLSVREFEVGEMVGAGLSNHQIADKLFVCLATVKTHVHHILKKTGCRNRTAIAGVYAGRL
jgi:DNA-binding NarL/FixJ family response regulator